MKLLLLYTSYNCIPQAVPNPGCLSFAFLATTSLRDTFFESSVITRIQLARVGLPPLFSFRHSFRYFSAGRECRRPKDTKRVQGELIEIYTGFHN